jgi:hypothetical protein
MRGPNYGAIEQQVSQAEWMPYNGTCWLGEAGFKVW